MGGADIVVGAADHIDAPNAAGCLDLAGGKARRFSEELGGLLGKDLRHPAIQPGDMQQPEKELFLPPGLLFDIAMDGLKGFFFGHHRLKGFVGGDPRQDLFFEMAP